MVHTVGVGLVRLSHCIDRRGANYCRQMSTLLSRPIIIDHSKSIVEEPSEKLEVTPATVGKPPPILHVVLQAQLGQKMDRQFQALAGEITTEQVLDFEKGLEDWMATFPRAFSMTHRDTSHPIVYPSGGR